MIGTGNIRMLLVCCLLLVQCRGVGKLVESVQGGSDTLDAGASLPDSRSAAGEIGVPIGAGKDDLRTPVPDATQDAADSGELTVEPTDLVEIADGQIEVPDSSHGLPDTSDSGGDMVETLDSAHEQADSSDSVDICAPACENKQCGPDGCGTSCGICDDGLSCTEDSCDDGACMFLVDDVSCVVNGICVAATTDNPDNLCQSCQPVVDAGAWSNKEDGVGCGPNAECQEGACICSILQCGEGCCGKEQVCVGGVCCAPDCNIKDCGDDGCGGSCGSCPDAAPTCEQGKCVCQPDCLGKECGTDGCVGDCGQCSGEVEKCSAGKCMCKGPTCEACTPHLALRLDSAQADSAYDNGLLYILTRYHGIEVVDVGVPESPFKIGEWNNEATAYSMAILADRIFVAVEDGIEILDRSVPTQILPVGKLAMSAGPVVVRNVNGTVWVGDETGKCYTLDLTNPDSPEALFQLQVAGVPIGMASDEDVLGVLCDWKLTLIDLTDPVAPEVAATINTGPGWHAAFGGDIALLTKPYSVGDNDVNVFDISDASSPVLVSALSLDNPAGGAAVTLADQFAYVGSAGYLPADAFVIDLADPAFPNLVGQVKLTPGGSKVIGLHAAGEHLHVVSDVLGFSTVSVAVPELPFVAGGYEKPVGSLSALVPAGADLATLDSARAHIQTLDAADPTAPEILAEFPSPNIGYTSDIAPLNQDYLVTVGQLDLTVLSLTAPGEPKLVGEMKPPYNFLLRVTVHGDMAYLWRGPVSTPLTVVVVVDVSDVAHPALAGTWNSLSKPRDVAVSGHVSYVGTTDGLLVLDTTVVAQPVTLDMLLAGTNISGLVAGQGHLYVVHTEGADVLNISDPEFPSPEGSWKADSSLSWPTVGWHNRFLDGTVLYHVRDKQLVALDVEDPKMMTVLGIFEAADFITAPVVQGDWVYVPSSKDGLLVLEKCW